MESKRKFYIKFTGSAFGIEADTPEQAWDSIRKILDVYCTPNILEIDVDCDSLGYPIQTEVQYAQHTNTRSKNDATKTPA